MGPREAAALVAREADAGVAAALAAIDASRALVPEQVVARVAAVPEGASLEDVTWQAEVTMTAGAWAAGGSTPWPATDETVESPVRELGVAAIRGAGPAWAERLTEAGWPSVGALAAATSIELRRAARRYGASALALAGLARLAVQRWPVLPLEARAWGSVLDVARADPSTLPGDQVAAHAAWALAVELLATIDGEALAKLPIRP